MHGLSKMSLGLLLTEGNFSCVKASKILGFVSHDQLTRELCKVVEYQATLTAIKDLPKGGSLIVDDTVIAKPHAEVIEGLAYIYSSSDDKVLLGMSMFFAVWQTPDALYQLRVELPGNRSKHELFQTLLQQLKEEDREPECVYFDSWYASSQTLNLIETLGWTFVTRIKANRLFEGKAVSEHQYFGGKGKVGKLKGVKEKVQIVKHGKRYLMTNRLLSTNTVALAKKYANRWVIETVFRALKSVHHLEKCSCQSLRAQFNHLLAAIRAHIWLSQRFPHLGPELAQREFIHQYHSGIITPTQILRHPA
jgi:Transposase DDE domain